MTDQLLTPIEIGLTAAIVSIDSNEPLILTASGSGDHALAGLPFGPFDALAHRTLEIGLRSWVEEQTGLRLGYVEQLYTFGDRGRHAQRGDTDAHVASVGYLALTRATENASRCFASAARCCRNGPRPACACGAAARVEQGCQSEAVRTY